MNQNNFRASNTFEFSPDVEFLQILAQGSLKQNLPKAVRLWVILRSLYGSEADPVKVELGNKFTYNDWCSRFFTGFNYHKNDIIPHNHDSNCSCHKTMTDWLFEPSIGSNDNEWKKSFLQLYPVTTQQLHNLLNCGTLSVNKESEKPQKKGLLAKTRRNFQYDFQTLVSLGWLQTEKVKSEPTHNKFKTQYIKVDSFPAILMSVSEEVVENQGFENLIQNDLADFFNEFSQKINHEQRFFLELEYIVHQQFYKNLNIWIQKLKNIWQSEPIPPIKITYVSASNFQNYQDEGEDYIIYPVCIYYSQRAPYLFAYGQTPKNSSSMKINWYGYRLDRIKNIEELEWSLVNLPNFSQKICESKTPQTLEKIRSETWGFNLARPQEILLIRFDRYYHNLYIQGTEREKLFQQISYKQAQSLINNSEIKLEQKQQLLGSLKSRSSSDIYCRVNYRQDYNTIMRLRSWGAKVEVFLPWDLRETMAKDIQQSWKFYCD
ncbi:MAG: TIGR03985 family CRISPR-associated protein [Okeania sp. SIO2F4]|uniref:TIGR03985 family CRISPR-associated protein n=1 Tax=Okeania sp. SIO2F4 TaxID=2607790 RepID=UPI00142A73FC|nr:TIGR03985 family CRISPR-associated protein [Okeania sp. SIO2F4]NES01747.1 TIGR03985 family CRISPR-associated protein [Okeania sp. SIO2F4]